MKSNAAIDAARGNIQKLHDELVALFPEREKVIQGLLVAILARQHIILIGPPGTGKTKLSRTVAGQLGLSFFSRIITSQSTEDSVLGAPHPGRLLQDGQIVRNTQDRLPEAQIAYLDEVFKSQNDGLLNSLLGAMEERIIENPTPQPIPLNTLIGSSNELPEDESLQAFWDRFALRYWVGYLSDRGNKVSLLKAKATGRWSTPSVSIDKNEINLMQAYIERMPISDKLLKLLISLQETVSKASIPVGERKVEQLLGLLRAYSFLAGEDAVDEEAFLIIPYCWGSTEKEIEAIEREVRRVAQVGTSDLENKYKTATSTIDNFREWSPLPSQSTDAEKAIRGRKLSNALSILNGIKSEIQPLASGSGRKAKKAQEYLDEIEKMIEEVSEEQRKIWF